MLYTPIYAPGMGGGTPRMWPRFCPARYAERPTQHGKSFSSRQTFAGCCAEGVMRSSLWERSGYIMSVNLCQLKVNNLPKRLTYNPVDDALANNLRIDKAKAPDQAPVSVDSGHMLVPRYGAAGAALTALPRKAEAPCRHPLGGGTMISQQNMDRVLTTHVGSLPRPHDLLDMMKARLAAQPCDEAAYQQRVSAAVMECVRQSSGNRHRHRLRRRAVEARLLHLCARAAGRVRAAA